MNGWKVVLKIHKLSTKILFVIIFILIISGSELITLINIVPEINTEKNMTTMILTGMIMFLVPALLLQIALFICVRKIEKLDGR